MVVLTLVSDLHHPVRREQSEKSKGLIQAAALLMEFFESLLTISRYTKLIFQRIKFVREIVIVRLIVLDICIWFVGLLGETVSDRGDLRVNGWCIRTYSMVIESVARHKRYLPLQVLLVGSRHIKQRELT